MRIRRLLVSVFTLCLLLSFASGGNQGARSVTSPSQITSNDLYRPFLINNVFNYYSNNGDGSFNKFTVSNEGFEFFKGDGKMTVFEDGVVWGGYHKGRTTPKVGGSAYRHALQAGPILTPGTPTTDPIAASSDDPAYRLFRVRPDINPSTPFVDVQSKLETEEATLIGRYETITAQQIYDQYIKDWNEWPAAIGAPYKDMDSNKTYDPTKDIPGQPGADQTLWYVANDCNQSRVTFLSGSPLIGLEMRRTIWGYKRANALGQTIFMSTLLINKSGANVDSMFLVQWADPDLGTFNDDFVGCDTSRNLGYVYNAGATDGIYGAAPPAVGFDILQGPIVPGAPGDTAVFRFKKRPGFKNLPMTTFDFFTGSIPQYADPIQGVGGDVQWYRLMRAAIASSGAPFINPTTGQATKFCLSGNPVSGTGWLDGTGGLIPGDRRMCLVTGPFTLAAGDSQELVVALIAGQGSDRLSSITALRSADDLVQSAFNGMAVGPTVGVAETGERLPIGTTLMQNYPNPFNPNSDIRYQISEFAHVRLSVFDLLAREVGVLVNEAKTPGTYTVTFNGAGLASGTYFYRLATGGHVETRKMIFLK
jgi:hypothetical protein